MEFFRFRPPLKDELYDSTAKTAYPEWFSSVPTFAWAPWMKMAAVRGRSACSTHDGPKFTAGSEELPACAEELKFAPSIRSTNRPAQGRTPRPNETTHGPRFKMLVGPTKAARGGRYVRQVGLRGIIATKSQARLPFAPGASGRAILPAPASGPGTRGDRGGRRGDRRRARAGSHATRASRRQAAEFLVLEAERAHRRAAPHIA